MLLDLQRAFESNKRNKLVNAMVKMKIDRKLIKPIKMIIKSTTIKINTADGETNSIITNKDVEQEYSISASLFNLALEYVLQNTD